MSEAPLTIHPIGAVQASGETYSLQINPQYRSGLKHLDQFSHLLVLWWANQHDSKESRAILQTALPYAGNLTAGVFACRCEFRPNPLAITVVDILAVDETAGVITIPYIDAFDQSPILDLKPYIPVSERVKQVRVPHWFADWPQWYEESGAFFSENGARLFGTE